ncbi:hypothetical protein HOG16_02415 [Candidatus Woesearchaeota archaeon]|jgi:hypothetical protein|nr:hypothetical protein [Candidatus Woesearchaeota archaeon]MBT4321950.1 hypothetical protein [Candidatus Woesearchaeota archaeon]MBT4631302.1 hypothetical protein [Candidatus Woesearchaeota archaeon]
MKKIYLFLIVALILVPFVQSEEVSDIEIELQLKIKEVEIIVFELRDEGFSIQRVNDTLEAAKGIFEVQSQRKSRQKDFTLVDKYLDEIFELKKQAYVTRDEINYVYEFYNDTKKNKPDMNLSEVDKILEEMQFEFDSERYDRAYDLSKKAYSRIIDIEGSYTAVNLAYQATARTLKNFLIDNWLLLLSILIGGTFLYFLFRNRIIFFKTKLRIRYLERQRGVLEQLIKETQSGYFEKSTIAESTYRIRTKKFSDMTRDINRQLPLLKEELAKRKKGEKPFEEKVKDRSKNNSKKKKKRKGSFSIFKKKKQNKIIKKKVVKKKVTKKKVTKKKK